MLKRMLAWLLVLVTVFSLVACRKKPAEQEPGVTEAATAQTAAPTVEPTDVTETVQPETTATENATLATNLPSIEPSVTPTVEPTAVTTTELVVVPTTEPLTVPTTEPIAAPTTRPVAVPTTRPIAVPTTKPTVAPTGTPTVAPTTVATLAPTIMPTVAPTTVATVATVATVVPTTAPIVVPTVAPTTAATVLPTAAPTIAPTTPATTVPTIAPTVAPTTVDTQPTETRKALAPLLELRGELPALKSRDEMLDTLQREVYGYIPDAPTNIEYTVRDVTTDDYCNGEAQRFSIEAKCIVNGQEFIFPFSMAVPKNATEKMPFFVFIGYTRGPTSRFQSTEAVIDKGYAIIYCNCNDIGTETGGFGSGLGTILYPDGKRGNTDPGKVAMWAWGAHRMMDFAEKFTDEYNLDMARSAVCGHSRTGKAALLAGATDTRIQFTYSNESGCAGSAISRRKAGENIQRITSAFPYWLCRNFKNWVARESVMPFDQHWLLACIAPRKVLVGSASKDMNADPLSEQLACLAASSAFTKGFACNVMALPGEAFLEGDIGYHLREGSHAFTETDWLRAIEFIDYHTKK